jgi:nucleoside-diphosphate-sugar epimerase
VQQDLSFMQEILNMKVLLLGTTGNLGSRLVPALLTHNHRVVAFVRSSHKLKSLLPPLVYQQITVVEGDATSPDAVKRAILDHDCDAVVSAAGVAALPPWGKSDLPKIFRAILEGVQEAGVERRNRLRVWFMGGLGLLLYPGTNTMLSK